ncbi:MAG TPA: 50S ribosomal protein L9 [Thiotrichales bacterium]|nr:50S ribosomal protein L9 [Thiotrichales bacterium]
MEVILLEKIENLGDLGDVVNVKPGFARNYLIPQGKAKYATAENIRELEARRAELEKAAAEAKAQAEARRERIEGQEITIPAKAGTEGRLFGSVGPADIAQALTEATGVEVAKRQVRMPEGPIHEVGETEITIHLHTDVNARIKVIVIAE